MRVRSFRKILAVVTSLGCAAFLMGLAGAPAAAAGETIQLNMNNPPQISGSGWAAGPLLVCRGAQSLGNADTGPGGTFTFRLNRAARVGEVYTVTTGGDCASRPVQASRGGQPRRHHGGRSRGLGLRHRRRA